MGNIELVIFDFYGTISKPIKTEKQAIEAFIQDVYELIGKKNKITIDDIREAFDGTIGFYEKIREIPLFEIPVDILIRTFTSRIGIFDQGQIYRILKLYTDRLAEANIIYDGAKKILKYLKNRNYKLCLLSNAQQYHFIDKTLDNAKIKSLFDTIIYSSDIGIRKPHPSIFKYATEKMGTTPEKTLMIGDDPIADFYGAIMAGINAILIIRDNQKYHILSKYIKEEKIIQSLLELRKLL